MKKKVLFICSHNAARSQMAEGYLRARYGRRYEAFSAGTEPRPVNPVAVAVMREIGVDISGQQSKPLGEFTGVEIDLAVTVCDSARAACPFFPWAKENVHAEFPDPVGKGGNEEQRLAGIPGYPGQIVSWIDQNLGKDGNLR